MRTITSQIFSVMYYTAPVWLTTKLNRPNLWRIESSFYTSLRISIKDFKKTMSKEIINKTTKRMSPRTCMKYSSPILAMKIIRDAASTTLYKKIMANSYQERREPFIIYTYDGSIQFKAYIWTHYLQTLEKEDFQSWINLLMKEIKFPWTT